MRRFIKSFAHAFAATALVLPGCSWNNTVRNDTEDDTDVIRSKYSSLAIESPDVPAPSNDQASSTGAPLTIHDTANIDYWDLRLEDSVQMALQNTKVLQDLGGLVLRSPSNIRTVQDPAIQESDPRFGVEAALSAFDATFATSAFVEKNDRALNNTFFGGGTRLLKQDAAVIQMQLSKRGATGTQYIVRNNTDYDANNAPGNQFPSAWNNNVEVEVRHPLLLGGGVDYNRIAGPSGTAGVANGVLLSRISTDISLADFEISTRNYVSDVENAYWDLYYAYRDLDAKVAARDAALETWRKISPQVQAGRLGAETEALAREQHFRLEEEVQNALTGRMLEGTHTNNGSSGGTFRATGGVNICERRLRLLMGLPINDGRLIRPADEPPRARIQFAWDNVLAEGLSRRTELRRQRWQIKRRELELEASRNFLKPQLDAIGRYRWRGFGRDLLQQSDPNTFDSAIGNLTDGKFQEWQLGAEFSVPLGFRKGSAAVRNAELLLARDRAILCEQERVVVLDLSNAMAEMERAYRVMETNYNRRKAAGDQLQALMAVEGYESDPAKLFVVLESQRRVADAENTYYRSAVEYALAVKNIHFEKGSLLDYNEVYLQEGAWPDKAYEDAEELAANRSRPISVLENLLLGPKVVSQGAYQQLVVHDPENLSAIISGQQTVAPSNSPATTQPQLQSEPTRTAASPRYDEPGSTPESDAQAFVPTRAELPVDDSVPAYKQGYEPTELPVESELRQALPEELPLESFAPQNLPQMPEPTLEDSGFDGEEGAPPALP